MKNPFLPMQFEEKYSRLLGAGYPAFRAACCAKEPKSIWCNTLRIEPGELIQKLQAMGWQLEQLAFSPAAFLILKGPQRPGQEEEFKSGLFNLQEKAAMLPSIILDPKPGERILDAFAAPGNKTLQIACLTNNEAEITALEREPARLNVLNFNARKFGMNASARKIDFQKFRDDAGFDRILLDAPCSSEGLVRKSLDGLKQWSLKKVLNMSKRQKKAVVKGFDLLKAGGTMVYSTCSLSPEEDEEVMGFLLEKREGASIEKIEIAGVKKSKGIAEFEGKKFNQEVENCARLYPHEWDCQPFFMAKIGKK